LHLRVTLKIEQYNVKHDSAQAYKHSTVTSSKKTKTCAYRRIRNETSTTRGPSHFPSKLKNLNGVEKHSLLSSIDQSNVFVIVEEERKRRESNFFSYHWIEKKERNREREEEIENRQENVTS